VLAFGIVQAEGAREGVDDGRAGPGLLAALQAGVVVDADPGQGGQFLTAQPGRAAHSRTDRQTDLAGRDPRATGAQEAPQLTTAADLLARHGYQPDSTPP
jgi:hypothetical protein